MSHKGHFCSQVPGYVCYVCREVVEVGRSNGI